MSPRRVSCSALVALALLFPLAGCGSDITAPSKASRQGPVEPVSVESIAIAPVGGPVETGAERALSATALDRSGRVVQGAQLTWAVASASIASVDGDGVVAGLSVGETEIRVSSGDVSASVTVEVVQGPRSPEDVDYDPSLDIALGQMARLPNGVYIQTSVAGSGLSVRSGTIVVDYAAVLPDGTLIESTFGSPRGTQFELGTGSLLPGFEAGVMGMQVGEERLIISPSALAFGDRQVGDIPPHSVLLFYVRLISTAG